MISKPEQDLAAAIRFQRVLERFLELRQRVYILDCGGERSISDEAPQLLVDLPDLCLWNGNFSSYWSMTMTMRNRALLLSIRW